jgi:mannose-1-phosphate guanylyltransferase / mannose-6-phosphate isomerase
MLVPVILSGGAGSRLWPVSREGHPKPFMTLPSGKSLLQTALGRALCGGVSAVLTITNRDHYFKTRDEYRSVPGVAGVRFDYVLEPCGRNTAPAIAAAALRLLETIGEDAVMLVLPADHLIADEAGFWQAARAAQQAAAQGYLVTFGIRPARAETGYGYIEMAAALPLSGECPVHAVNRFVEKPDARTAQEYLSSGRFMWNSGMFCFKATAYLDALRQHAPEIFEATKRAWDASDRSGAPVELAADDFAQVSDLSVDYAVMERAERVAAVVGSFDWSDIGSWDAISQLIPADAAGNRVSGEAILVGAQNCFIEGAGRLVAAVGTDDLLIVDTADAVLVAKRDQAQQVKQVVAQLKASGHEAYKLHRTVHRPWGTYTILEEGERFKIKRIVVRPGASLSLQMHHHRSEHWVVVSGTAKVVNGDQEILVRTNESTYIPSGTPHRLVNPGVLDLVMIEVQSGEYLGEDDIVRFEDKYGRK